MWIKLTRNDLEPVLVDADRLTHIVPRTGGGSTLYFAEDGEKKADAKPKALAVRDTVPEIYNLLKAAEGTPAAGSRARAVK
ncbi:hypothetical protein ACSBOB_14310 [Mesorhizobium sp. ASY16-5R]|jgi:hypothetical protein|uniref:hypothetical protein n=1 Tax=Mesorhizobium sp. ASY16-5R TaxID=3445772 RepID=UPI003F9F5C6A